MLKLLKRGCVAVDESEITAFAPDPKTERTTDSSGGASDQHHPIAKLHGGVPFLEGRRRLSLELPSGRRCERSDRYESVLPMKERQALAPALRSLARTFLR